MARIEHLDLADRLYNGGAGTAATYHSAPPNSDS
jgi:hypothetical protein